jgi:cell division septation protein DedD
VKERLTGAIILVALIVLLVPELLTGPIRLRSAPAAASTAAVASADTGDAAHGQPPLRSYTMTLGAPPPVAQSPAAASTQALAQPTVISQQGPAESSPQPPTPAASQSDAAHTLQKSTAGESGGLQDAKSPAHSAVEESRSSGSPAGWVVQLGSFASRQNAERLARSLESRGFRMSVSPARAGSRVLWRVRAGPAHNRAGAERLAARLRALGHRGEILPGR